MHAERYGFAESLTADNADDADKAIRDIRVIRGRKDCC